MKEFTQFFARRYSVVNSDDDQHNHHQQQVTGVATLQNVTPLSPNDKQHKSLKAKHSMNPSGILNTFFNERSHNNKARSPTCKYLEANIQKYINTYMHTYIQ